MPTLSPIQIIHLPHHSRPIAVASLPPRPLWPLVASVAVGLALLIAGGGR
jgi:hypothetical protein